MTFIGLIGHNVVAKKMRLALTCLAVAIGVLAVVSLGVVTHSLQTTDLAVLQTGRADFTIAQKNVNDILSSSIDAATTLRLSSVPGVRTLIGVLISTSHLDASNPQFLEIGIDPANLSSFGVSVVAGRPFSATASDQVMLGWRAAEDLSLHVGDRLAVGGQAFLITGIYSTGQSLGDDGAMFPIVPFQTLQREPAQYTLLFVQSRDPASITALQARIDRAFPELTTIRTLQQFGRADRSLALIQAANRGASILAIVVGAVVMMSAMSMTFIERIREFGVLAAVGWAPRRLGAMILSEAMVTGLIGAAGGIALSVLAVLVVQHLPSLEGVLHPDYTASIFVQALLTALVMVLLGGLVPAARAARAQPSESLRHE